MIANIFFQGDESAVRNIDRSYPDVGHIQEAHRTTRPIWYYNLPTYRFDQLSLDVQLLEYVRHFQEVIAASKQAKFHQSFLSIRTSNEEGERAALWLSNDLLGELHKLGLSVDFSDEPYLATSAPLWNSRTIG